MSSFDMHCRYGGNVSKMSRRLLTPSQPPHSGPGRIDARRSLCAPFRACGSVPARSRREASVRDRLRFRPYPSVARRAQFGSGALVQWEFECTMSLSLLSMMFLCVPYSLVRNSSLMRLFRCSRSITWLAVLLGMAR